jgi:hypothetical protein
VTDAAHVEARVTQGPLPGHTTPAIFRRDGSRPVIVLDNFPPYVSTDDIAMTIGKRGQEYAWKARHPELGEQTGLPIKYLVDQTTREDYWFACVPDADTPAEVLRSQLLNVYGVTLYVSVGLRRPLATVIRTWTRTHQHEDLNASLTALENALPSRH